MRLAVQVTELQNHYKLLAPYLGIVPCVLDIGCGMAGMDILLVRHHGTLFVHLVDGTGSGIKPDYSYIGHATEAWNDVELGKLLVNEATPGAIVSAHVVTEDRKCPVFDPEPNLIMSLFSCGFHYPLESYLDWFLQYPNARVLLDLRVHRKLPRLDAIGVMHAAGYPHAKVVMEYDKGKRVLFERNKP